MFSKEESKQLREEFWTSFGKSYPRKWILYNTKIKNLSLKFHFDRKIAMVCLDLEDDLDSRINRWDKLTQLKGILITEYLPTAVYEDSYFLSNGKEISRIFVSCVEQVSIHDKGSWGTVMRFLYDTMDKFESFFLTNRDFISA